MRTRMSKKVCSTHYCMLQKIWNSENHLSKKEVWSHCLGFLHIYWYNSCCPYKNSCVQMELHLLTREMWKAKPGYFPFKMTDLVQLFYEFCRCCHHWVPVADKHNFSIDGQEEGETTKASLQSKGWVNSQPWSKMFCIQTFVKSRAVANLALTVCFVQKKWEHKENCEKKLLP